MNKKILLLDIETAPNLAYVWGKYEQNVIAYKKEGYMISFSCKWLGDTKIHGYTLADFPLYKRDKESDQALIGKLWEYFDAADVIIAHNGDRFDIKKSNTFFVANGLTPPSPYATVDTRKIAKKYFMFNSNKLDDLGEYLGLGRKLQTGGFDLWLGCLAGDQKSWAKMLEYNKQDIVLLESVYKKLLPWMDNHPHVNPLNNCSCPKCGSMATQKRGTSVQVNGWKQIYHCRSCGGNFRGKLNKHNAEETNGSTAKERTGAISKRKLHKNRTR